ncbi:helix-turn-helix domain-containing protein [Paenibacillus silviterrae]|uniref:helix-turn-helix domain-containing protein n=1 Tax=Paenibacillus silviterrae TaxID=3242194 RepID=UPI00254333A0|nr:AraC family transcriptional regulator [Paenibacillus chinjuensis]
MKEYAQEFAQNIFFAPDKVAQSLHLWPVRLGKNLTKPNYLAGPKTIDYYSLHLIQAGTIHMQYKEQTIALEKGDLFCLWPGTPFSYRPADPRTVVEMTWVAFAGAQAPVLLELLGITENLPFARGALSSSTEMILQQLWRAAAQDKTTQLSVLSLIYQLFDQLHGNLLAATSIHSRQKHWVQRSIEYMDAHYSEPISVSHVASQVGIHRTYFTKVFTEQVGLSPVQYLIKLKMEKAMRLLKETTLTVTEIAFSLSYSDSASFSRSFAAYFGRPPTYFRRKHD